MLHPHRNGSDIGFISHCTSVPVNKPASWKSSRITSTNTSTPTTCQMSPNPTAFLNPVLDETSSSASSINSPLAIATVPDVNSPNSVAAVLLTLQ